MWHYAYEICTGAHFTALEKPMRNISMALFVSIQIYFAVTLSSHAAIAYLMNFGFLIYDMAECRSGIYFIVAPLFSDIYHRLFDCIFAEPQRFRFSISMHAKPPIISQYRHTTRARSSSSRCLASFLASHYYFIYLAEFLYLI
jgi:hypothetical protein